MEPSHVKEEQDELWISQEREHLRGLGEADATKFPFPPVTVKSEDDEEKPQPSLLHQRQSEEMETAADDEGCGGVKAERYLPPETEVKAEDSSEAETEDSDDWRETGGNHSRLNSSESDDSVDSETRERCSGLNSGENTDCERPNAESHSCSECGTTFKKKQYLNQHMRTHTGEKPFSCSKCGKRFTRKGSLMAHLIIHTGEKPFSCSDCGKTFNNKRCLSRHVSVHTGEKPFSCSFCSKKFTQKGQLKSHLLVHTGEKQFSCFLCSKSFTQKGQLKSHMLVHTREKPFSCTLCSKSFTQKGKLKSHMLAHMGEKHFSCFECGKKFSHKYNLTLHMSRHAGEKRYTCSLCNERFFWHCQLKKHSCIRGQTSELHQNQTEEDGEAGADGEDCGGAETDPERHSHPETEVTAEDTSEG